MEGTVLRSLRGHGAVSRTRSRRSGEEVWGGAPHPGLYAGQPQRKTGLGRLRRPDAGQHERTGSGHPRRNRCAAGGRWRCDGIAGRCRRAEPGAVLRAAGSGQPGLGNRLRRNGGHAETEQARLRHRGSRRCRTPDAQAPDGCHRAAAEKPPKSWRLAHTAGAAAGAHAGRRERGEGCSGGRRKGRRRQRDGDGLRRQCRSAATEIDGRVCHRRRQRHLRADDHAVCRPGADVRLEPVGRDADARRQRRHQ